MSVLKAGLKNSLDVLSIPHSIELTMLALELVRSDKGWNNQRTYGTPYPIIVERKNFVSLYIYQYKRVRACKPGSLATKTFILKFDRGM